MTAWVSLVSMFGLTCSLSGTEAVPLPIVRFLTGFGVVLVFARNPGFYRMLHTFNLALRATLPLITGMVVLMMIFAIMYHDNYKHDGVDDDGNGYFEHYSKSLATVFRLLVGEAWHEVMFATSDSTQRQTTKLFFIGYIMLCTLFFSQLFIGIILNLYQASP